MFAYPNTITKTSPDFYISFNGIDSEIYGGDTTALVWGQMQKFYILMGDHQKAYAALMNDGGFDACLAYYKANIHLSHRYSDKV